MKKRGPGRPKKVKASQHLHEIKVRLTKTQYRDIESKARAANVVLARFIRTLLTGEV